MGIRDFTCKELGEVGWSRIIMNLPRIYHEWYHKFKGISLEEYGLPQNSQKPQKPAGYKG